MRFVRTTGFYGVGIFVYPHWFVCCKSTLRFLSDASNYFFSATMKGSVTGEWVCEAGGRARSGSAARVPHHCPAPAGDSGHWERFREWFVGPLDAM